MPPWGPHPLTGRRRQRTKGGYQTKQAAEQALAEATGQWRTGRLPQRSTHTLSHFLQEEWLPAVKPRLRPSTWANYRTYTAAYVVPILGQIKLQALTPVQLNSTTSTPTCWSVAAARRSTAGAAAATVAVLRHGRRATGGHRVAGGNPRWRCRRLRHPEPAPARPALRRIAADIAAVAPTAHRSWRSAADPATCEGDAIPSALVAARSSVLVISSQSFRWTR
jgi:hypothetical protein